MDDAGETAYETTMFSCFNLKIHLYLCLLVNETKIPQHIDCGRSIPATNGGENDSAEPRLESFCLVHSGVRDKRRVSEIDLSQPRHETAFWWCHNGAVTSQLTDQIKWPNYPLELITIYVHINTHNKESMSQRCRRSTNVHMCLTFLYISIWIESKWMACLISHHK